MTKRISIIALIAMLMASAPAIAKEKTIGGKPGDATIAQIVSDAANPPAGSGDAPEFTILLSLLQDTGLDAVLSGSGPFTVFAPTDEAFGPILGTAAGLTGPQLTNILLYHVTKGRRFSNSVVDDEDYKSIKMLNGGVVMSTPDGFLIDTSDIPENVLGLPAAEIEAANLKASNGVIHVITEVLVPENLLD
ncbi:fasciclin domain-containing protein [Pseudomonadota bacterium]